MGLLKRKNLLPFVSIVASILVFSFLVPSVRSPLRSVVRLPLMALTALKNEVGGIIFYHRNMVQIRRMAMEIDLLKCTRSQTQEARLESARLRELLSLKKSLPYKVISADVIGRTPSSWSSSLILDKGSAHGIRKGYICVGFYGLIGRIVEVSVSSSTVMLINDPNLCVSSLIQRSRQEGLICGSLGGVLLMKYLTKDSDVKVSDTVLTSGLTDAFPKGIVVGSVIAVREEMSGVSKYAVARS